ncbi:MAG: ammonia channel protein [Sphingobacteriales bacterium SCN 48-20]|jgi:Amt family ammonium transporter|uniref:ammonium transporter n=1 Tax=Terrimonas ferruginea TaxID=249 RepID=UPI00086AB8D9|nr:ammonium transporter [Terrimonas ferruginea]MBN8782670.1 ammonium transporter [Terrimonas ferruginea]ODT92852.1 MAG: ammonia channel protein [Sphingobacteriales bacterium SCN 48-20]OJW43881.1 MAG: ammonia channel protein [Sphingobacteriales bacterium 48-107]
MPKLSIKQIAPFLVLTAVAVAAIFVTPGTAFDPSSVVENGAPKYTYDSGDIAWMLVSCAFVFLMTPALAFFYGGMVGRKNVLSTMIKSTVSAGIISVLWVVVQFSLCFGKSINGIIGDPSTFFFFKNVMNGEPWPLASTIPLPLFAFFQLMFAIITPGLVVGAVAERIRFSSYTLFIVLFGVLVYAPLAHMAWHPEGLMFQWGVQDFAGGTVVHISAGMAALAGALVLKPRKNKTASSPANIPYVLIGTGLLWFGWFGFNAGSAVGAGSLAVYAFATTNTAAAAAGLAWMFFDVVRGKKPSVLGFCIGAVVGLVAITPAAGFVGVPQAIFIGFVAAIVSNYVAEVLKHRTKLDDPLDVFACHGLGGMTGMLLTGVFSMTAPGESALFKSQFPIQLVGMVVAVSYSFIVSFILFKVINWVMPMRVSEQEEESGLDASQHDEKYFQGHLIVNGTNGSLTVTETIHKEIEIVKE